MHSVQNGPGASGGRMEDDSDCGDDEEVLAMLRKLPNDVREAWLVQRTNPTVELERQPA